MPDTPVQTINKLRLDLFRMRAGLTVHADPTPAITMPDATSIVTAITLANATKAALTVHFASVIDPTTGVGTHGSADAAVTAPDATTESDLGLLVRALVAAHNSHVEKLVVHFQADRSHFAAYTPRTGSFNELFAQLNDLKTAVNGHFAASMNAGVAA